MQFRPLLILCAFWLVSPQDSWADKKYRVVVFGDSLTSGYQLQGQDSFTAQLQNKIRAAGYEKIEVINMSKENASSASATAETDLVRQKLPDVIIIELGFNDARHGVLPSAIAYNLSTIITELQRTGAYIVLMGVTAPLNMGESYGTQIVNNYYDVAKAKGVALYPDALESIAGSPSLSLADGLHPNTAGVRVMVEGIFPLVDEGLRWRYQVYLDEVDHLKKTQLPGASNLPPIPSAH